MLSDRTEITTGVGVDESWGGAAPGWVLSYWSMVGRFHGDDPRFGYFQSDWVPFYASS